MISVLQVEKQPKEYSPELDGVRGLAILGVLCSHGAGLSQVFAGTNLADKLVRYAMVPLWGGVDLFFVLSGFLITGILLRTKPAENYFSSFYARRILRIFPIYYTVLFASLVLGHFSAEIAAQLPQWLSWKAAYFFYLQNWPMFWHGEKIMGGQWGVYWSLAVEEQFYFVWPLVVMLFQEKTIARICYFGLAVALPLRIFLSYAYFGSNFGLAQLTSSRVDGLLFGAACAVYTFHHKKPVPMVWIAASATLGALIMGYIVIFHHFELVATGSWMTTVGITGFSLLSGALVAASQHRIPLLHGLLTMGWLRKVGKYSYGMYVYHLFVFIPIRYFGNRIGLWYRLTFMEQWLCFFAEALAVFLVAKLSYDVFESRFLSLKSCFKPRYRDVTLICKG